VKHRRSAVVFGHIFLLVSLLVQTPTVFEEASALELIDKAYEETKKAAMGICPPINLLDEKGNIIDPTKNLNGEVPYSPRMTCGKCHDYDKITRGYHFQQGKGEKMTEEFRPTYPWCTSPGQYGGRW